MYVSSQLYPLTSAAYLMTKRKMYTIIYVRHLTLTRRHGTKMTRLRRDHPYSTLATLECADETGTEMHPTQ